MQLSSLQGADQVKNQFEFAEYYDGFGFYGTLSSMSADVMFAVKTASEATLTVTGAPVALPKSVTLYRGWTWVPCPYQTAVQLADALTYESSAGTSLYAAGDQFKSQFEFAEFYAGFGFYGTLTTVEPGKGYRVKTSEAGTASFAV
uniref:Uncharacterized protein n=1 Tax=Haptolina ericina TaxID=156174 RepID=A0A7S3BKZ5_9EUKA